MKRLFHNRAPALLFFGALALAGVLCPRPARADVLIFDTKADFDAANTNSLEQIHFNSSTDSSGPSQDISGHTQSSNLHFSFHSDTQDLTIGGAGYAFVQADGVPIIDPVTMQLADGYTFLAFDAELAYVHGGGPPQPTTAHITVLDANGNTHESDVSVDGLQDFFGVVATDGDRILSVAFDPVDPPGLDRIDHMDIGGITATPVPEPHSLALLAAGGLPFLGLLRRRRSADPLA